MPLIYEWIGGEPELARSRERGASVDLRVYRDGEFVLEREEREDCMRSVLSPEDEVLVLRLMPKSPVGDVGCGESGGVLLLWSLFGMVR